MSNTPKKGFFLTRWFKRTFLGHDQEVRDIMKEEQVQTPFRTMARAFFSKRTVRIGLTGFILIFLFVLIGPNYWVLDLSEQDSTLINLPPSSDFMAVPQEMNGNIVDIAAGRTYGIGVARDGKIHAWGYTRITDKVDIANIPKEVQEADIVQLAAGEDHAVALSSDGQIYVWGNTRLQQAKFSSDMTKAMKAAAKGEKSENWDIIQLEASNQFSAALSSDGTLYLWGNTNMADIKIRSQYQGNVAKVALTSNEYICLLKDGTVAYAGYKDKGSPFAAIPAGLEGKTVVDVAATSGSMAALTSDGEVYVWGSSTSGEKKVPAFSQKVTAIYGGRAHYDALL